jgi:hypothetical protein
MEPRKKIRPQLVEEERQALEAQTKAASVFTSLPGEDKFVTDAEDLIDSFVGIRVEEVDNTETVEQSENGSFFVRVKKLFKRNDGGKNNIS